ncbi:MAG: AAA family ATPase [Candidatus Heimdallarchaeota archaeon]|nr:AAA family ATPase [Candidatus Heimdallarchaeota archaeon]
MKILELEINDFEGIKHLKLNNIPDYVILMGKNGSGKSTILRALNAVLRYTFYYQNDIRNGHDSVRLTDKIRIKIDFSDHINDFRAEFIDFIEPQMLAVAPYIYNALSGRSFSVHHENFVTILISNLDYLLENNFILEISDKGCRFEMKKFSFENLEINNIDTKQRFSREIDQRNSFLQDMTTNQRFEYYFGYLIHRWLKTRFYGNSSVPGYSFLDMENINPRNIGIEFGKMNEISSNRIGFLMDQNWRINNLGGRLAALVMDFSARVADEEYSQIFNPVKRINRSLTKLLPHIKLKSPKTNSKKIILEVRGKELTLDKLSTGELYLIVFAIDYLEMELNNGVIMIDEPSIHMHYSLQGEFMNFLEELISGAEKENKASIWIASHSPSIISSVPKEQRFLVDIENTTNAIIPFTDLKDNEERSVINKTLGINTFYEHSPVLFVEGTTDFPIVKAILDRFAPELLPNWTIKRTDGVDELLKVKTHTEELLEIGNKIKSGPLFTQLRNNHFLLDGDNTRHKENDSRNYIWGFYHIENLLFQDPWIDYLVSTLEINLKNEVDFEKDLVKAIENTYNSLHEKPEISLEEIKSEEWKNILPGREIFKQLTKIWGGGGKFERIIRVLLNRTNHLTDAPIEIQDLINWMNNKYSIWKEDQI